MVEEERTVETPAGAPAGTQTHTTVVERRSGGGGGAVLIGLAVLIVAIVLGFYLFNRSQNDNIKTNAVTQAAHSVSDSAQKVGDSAQKAADDATGQ
ncbi:MAG: hypothetical protein ACTHMG_10985 [Sphingomonas sp.]